MISQMTTEEAEKLCHCLKALEKFMLETNQVLNWKDGEVISFVGVRKLRQHFTTEALFEDEK